MNLIPNKTVILISFFFLSSEGDISESRAPALAEAGSWVAFVAEISVLVDAFDFSSAGVRYFAFSANPSALIKLF